MSIWQLCANLLIPNCLRSNLSYSPLAALELYVKQPYLYELEKEMQNYDIDMIVYPVDVSRTIGEHTLRIDSIMLIYV